MCSGQVAAARHASSITQSPIAMIRPVSSASGMNIVGRDHAAGRVVPADQRLEADQALVGGVDQRLVEQVELLERDRRRAGRCSSRTRSSCSDLHVGEK